MTQLPEEAINIGALTHANSLLRLWHQEPLTMEQAELMPDWESYREHLKDALTAVYPAIEKQIRAQVAADIWEYWDACGDLIDDRDSARQAIDAIAAQIAKGESK